MRMSSNNLLEGLNFIMAALSVAVIGASAWLATHSQGDCVTFLQWPFMVIGLLIFAVGLLGFMAAWYRSKLLLLLYLLLLVPLVLLFLAFTVFAVVVTAQTGQGYSPARWARFREYTSADFSSWLQKRAQGWNSTRACLARSRLCRDLDLKYKTLRQLYSARDLSPTQVGCCKPPSMCGFVFETATTWARPSILTSAEPMSDCMKWSNDPSQLCFSCDSCRAGDMQTIRRHWFKLAATAMAVLILLLSLLALTSFGLYNLKRDAIPDEPKLLSPYI